MVSPLSIPGVSPNTRINLPCTLLFPLSLDPFCAFIDAATCFAALLGSSAFTPYRSVFFPRMGITFFFFAEPFFTLYL